MIPCSLLGREARLMDGRNAGRTLRELAVVDGTTPSTVAKHLRHAERRIWAEMTDDPRIAERLRRYVG